MSVQNFVPVHHINIEIFHRIRESFDLLVVQGEKSGDHQNHNSSSGHHGTMFHFNPFNYCVDISLKIKNERITKASAALNLRTMNENFRAIPKQLLTYLSLDQSAAWLTLPSIELPQWRG